VVSFGTNVLGNYQLTPDQQQSLNLGTNRFVAVQIEPLTVGTNRVLGWHVSNDPEAIASAQRMKIDLINLHPAGGFFVVFQVAFYAGILLASPFIFFFVASFVFPALRFNERKYIYRGLIFGGGLFLAGICLCYFALLPRVLSISQFYSNWLGFGAMQWRAEDYISFVCRFMLGMGLGFQVPIVILTLVKMGVLSYSTLARARRYMIVINLVLGAVLTTPEVLTQMIMFVPLQLLYEITVWVAWYWDQPDRARARRRLLLAVLLLVLAGCAAWVGYQHGWPWLRQHWSR
ncbi:MAG TPA: twin-arginine translocase subunit TatC, partial [Verrucomicrobiae bacterium]|nr:twin-arginine translocase subunit TatC [Verrucomicrobiae bacterium]